MKFDKDTLDAIAQIATALSDKTEAKEEGMDTNIINEASKKWRDKYAKYKAAKDTSDNLHKEAELLKYELRDILEEAGIEKYFVPDLGTVYTKVTKTWSFPKDPDKKTEFFGSVREKHGDEVLQGLITVAYQTLNSYCKGEAENGSSDFPGLEEPKERKDIGFRKG
jgi:hypothetical protein